MSCHGSHDFVFQEPHLPGGGQYNKQATERRLASAGAAGKSWRDQRNSARFVFSRHVRAMSAPAWLASEAAETPERSTEDTKTKTSFHQLCGRGHILLPINYSVPSATNHPLASPIHLHSQTPATQQLLALCKPRLVLLMQLRKRLFDCCWHTDRLVCCVQEHHRRLALADDLQHTGRGSSRSAVSHGLQMMPTFSTGQALHTALLQPTGNACVPWTRQYLHNPGGRQHQAGGTC